MKYAAPANGLFRDDSLRSALRTQVNLHGGSAVNVTHIGDAVSVPGPRPVEERGACSRQFPTAAVVVRKSGSRCRYLDRRVCAAIKCTMKNWRNDQTIKRNKCYLY